MIADVTVAGVTIAELTTAGVGIEVVVVTDPGVRRDPAISDGVGIVR